MTTSLPPALTLHSRAILDVLRAESLAAHGGDFPLSLASLASRAGCTVATASKWVERFLASGLIERTHSGRHSGSTSRYRLREVSHE